MLLTIGDGEEDNPKNIILIKGDNVYIYGLGNYTGTNTIGSVDLATFCKNIQTNVINIQTKCNQNEIDVNKAKNNINNINTRIDDTNNTIEEDEYIIATALNKQPD